jgi:hypothetical protein
VAVTPVPFPVRRDSFWPEGPARESKPLFIRAVAGPLQFGPAMYASDQSLVTLAKQRGAEDDRQRQIRAGQSGIDSAFAQFDSPYYEAFRRAYTNFYNPQVADQFEQAKGKLTASLAGRGMLESTTGANRLTDLFARRAGAEADIGNQSVDAANKLRGQIEGAKTNLYQLNAGAADPALAANQAQGAAASFATQPQFSPLGQVFASALPAVAAFQKADANSLYPRLPWNGVAPTSGRGSSMFS